MDLEWIRNGGIGEFDSILSAIERCWSSAAGKQLEEMMHVLHTFSQSPCVPDTATLTLSSLHSVNGG